MSETTKLLGQYLREAREMRGLSLEEVAQETKINKVFLEALENEDWDSLPAEIYVRGYLRSYAEAVGLDPKEVLLRYDSIERPKKNEVFEKEVLISQKSFSLFWSVLILIVLLFIMAYLFLFRS
ncbi:helix-turn-helix domain-containing protein [Thermosulfurimonas dismutans]|uniref:Transcriptional regulator in cluster with unspecified monosaccharide ABC transport system n=1 Tax=Thermosulfurimonas dismutans TaxID=999894 RepID=A0A179D3T0_9BACT|nr:helix-turn-helix domain-containing protein [Thermosulfurimonas dismutans]OAQ20461.1 Transcriptional regulator in cluster with unspecified monosaccharide ABC transport system [Thermosulfurimonas dismutans]